jgi:hypothetical protein
MAGLMGLIFVIIVSIGVAIPITTTVITSANLTGLNATLAGFCVTFLVLSVLSLIARMGGMA